MAEDEANKPAVDAQPEADTGTEDAPVRRRKRARWDVPSEEAIAAAAAASANAPAAAAPSQAAAESSAAAADAEDFCVTAATWEEVVERVRGAWTRFHELHMLRWHR